MSLNRSAVRVAAVSALSNFMSAPWPTLAEGLIFDSKIEPIENVEEDQVYPMAVVYTDYDKDFFVHGSMLGTSRMMTLTIETLIATVKDHRDQQQFALRYPATDAELEFSLDCLDTQIADALYRSDNIAADCFRNMVTRIETTVSRRGASTEGGHKLAARQLTMEMEVLRDPIDGVLPDYVKPLLDRLDQGGESQERSAMLREMYLRQGAPAPINRGRHLGYPSETMGILGIQPTPTVVVPPIVWLGPNGQPL